MASSVSVVPYQMIAGDEKVVADRLYALLSKPPKMENPPAPPSGPARERRRSVGRAARFRSRFGEPHARAGAGRREADGDASGRVRLGRSERHGRRQYGALPEFATRTDGTRVSFQFTGTAEGGKMSGTVALGEYGEARWTAEKHQYRAGGRRG